MRSRKSLVLAAQAAISVGLLALLFRGLDWTEFAGALRRVPAPLYIVALLVTTAGQVLYAFKWYVAVRAVGLEVPFPTVLGRYFIGIFFNNFLPSTIGGDWARVYYLGDRRSYIAAGASVFMDRYLGALWLAVLAAVMLWSVPVPGARWLVARTVVSGLAGVLAGCWAVALLVPRGQVAGRLSGRAGLIGRVATQASGFVTHVRTTLLHPAAMCAGAATVFLYFVLQTLIYQRFFDSVAAVHLGFWPAITAVSTISLLSMVPIAVNGLGVREQLHVLLLASLGIPREVAFAISTMLFAQLIVLSAVGLLLWLRCQRRVVPADPDPARAELYS